MGFDHRLNLFDTLTLAEHLRLSQFVVQLLQLAFVCNNIVFQLFHLAVGKTTFAARLAGVPALVVGCGRGGS